jgi:hypothetical protein
MITRPTLLEPATGFMLAMQLKGLARLTGDGLDLSAHPKRARLD